MSSTNPCQGTTSLPDCHWELCHRFMARYQHLFLDGQVATLAHFFANTQLLLRGHADQTRQLVLDLVPNGDQQAEVSHGMGNVENGIVKKEPVLESVPPDVAMTIKQEPNINELPEFVDCNGPPELAQAFEEESTISALEDHSNCITTGPSMEKSPEQEHPTLNSDAEVIANLTYFKPVPHIWTIEDLYRNLVIFDSDIEKTNNELKRLGSGSLNVKGHELPCRRCRGVVSLRELILAEAWDMTVQQAKEKAILEFFRTMKAFCYQIVSNKPNPPAIRIARLEDPTTNIEHYKSIIQKFTQQELIFGEEFKLKDLKTLKWAAFKLNMEARYVRPPQSRLLLKVRPRTVPALAIVERIVIHKDPALSELYVVFPPRVGSRRW